MKTVRETRRLYSGDLRRLCIEKDWYTDGTNERYDKLLHFVGDKINISTMDIVAIAEDIMNNSDTDYPIDSICYEVAEVCHSIFEVME